jgi:hypothetical protein
MKKQEKQRKDLQNKFYKEEIDSLDLIELLIQAREQRDEYKKTLDKFKNANSELAHRMVRANENIRKATKLLVLN